MAENMSAPNQEQEINPWSVEGARDENGEIASIDYEAISPGGGGLYHAQDLAVACILIIDRKWNTPIIDQKLLERFEKVTGHKPHRWLRRGLFFSHRDFDRILNLYERGEPFFLYTGHGPSTGSLHLGHTIPLQFTKWLQDIFDVTLVFMLTEDALGNARDIIAIDIDMKKAFIYSDLKYFAYSYAVDRQYLILIPIGIDQDPYFRLLWDNAYKKKINKYAFSGGQVSVVDHRSLGGNPDVDVSYIYLTYFEEDDAKLEEDYRGYKSGSLDGRAEEYGN
ncbi:hypothetical protein BDV23DRAFT_187403 [Aspergillus alliaceus]|uniref:Tryptophanyl-tRNA synthetase n=1 Tax=Petromyces alliaceus TaxID=209559 RepID=A0A5N7BXB8_PETAA|nr:hypothetical protein BDV23DRAFT_187403 [Aspergillus alliaceus]